MAGIVKRLRPWIVVPLCVGSNPTVRPIFKTPEGVFFSEIRTQVFSSKIRVLPSRQT